MLNKEAALYAIPVEQTQDAPKTIEASSCQSINKSVSLTSNRGSDYFEVCRNYLYPNHSISLTLKIIELYFTVLKSHMRGMQVVQLSRTNCTVPPLIFRTTTGWLLPRHIASSLKVLVFGGKIQVVSFTRFISNFCPCPDDFLELDVSGFPNLNRLHYDLGYLEDNVNAFCRVLSQNDTSRLKHITIFFAATNSGN
ncbi:unnamed protein product [Somion occarium]|uniref:Uncharacterized protein n=1 Tax=Somion occarium TaxID=3059160 RepID=A0ABP1DPK7_9APHY